MSRCYVLLLTFVVVSFLGNEPFQFFATAVDDNNVVTSNTNPHYLRVSIRSQFLQDAPSCQHSIAQIELLNPVSDFLRARELRSMKEILDNEQHGLCGPLPT